MATIRRAGQLYETPTDVPVVTPAATAAEGGSPDAAKMAGTPAQKTAALKTATSLSGQQRLTPSATPPSTDAAQRAAQLRDIGSLGSRVQAAIEAKLGEAYATTATAPALALAVSPEALGQWADRPELQARVKGLLEAYAAKPTEAGLQALSAATGQAPEAFTGGGLVQYYQSPESVLAGAAARPVSPLTLADIAGQPDSGVDLDKIASTLGVPAPQVAAWTPDQFQQAVRDLQAQDFSQTSALKAELVTAGPQRAAQIQAQLRALGEAGITGAESTVQGLSDQLEAGEQVEFPGLGPVNVRELLADDTVSQEIRQALASPSALATLRTASPALADWVERNRAALQDVTTAIDVQARQFADVQTQASTTQATAPEISTALGLPTGPVTAAEAAAAKARLEANPLYQAQLADTSLKAKLTPAELTAYATLDKPQLEATLAMSAAIAADAVLAQILGVVPNQPLTPDLVAQATQLKPAWDAAKAALLPAEPWFQDALKAGEFADPVKLQAAVDSYKLMGARPPDPTLDKLLGWSKFTLEPLTPKDTALVKSWDALTPKLAGQLDDLGRLVDSGLVTTPAQLNHLAEYPHLVADVVAQEGYAAAAKPALTTKYNTTPAANGVPKDAKRFAEDIAKAIGFKSAKDLDAKLGSALERAQDALRFPDRYQPSAVATAKAFLAKLAPFDLDGDGQVTREDFGTITDERHPEYANQAAHFKTIQDNLAKVVGTRSPEAILKSQGYTTPYETFREWKIDYASQAADMGRKSTKPKQSADEQVAAAGPLSAEPKAKAAPTEESWYRTPDTQERNARGRLVTVPGVFYRAASPKGEGHVKYSDRAYARETTAKPRLGAH